MVNKFVKHIILILNILNRDSYTMSNLINLNESNISKSYLLTKHMSISTHGKFHFHTIQTLTDILRIKKLY